MIEPFLKAQLSRDEGRKLYAYRDLNGHWTIGVGHLVELDPFRKIAVPRITLITEAECDALLVADVEIAALRLGRVFGDALLTGLNAPRYRALVNMMFNRGEAHVKESTTITPAIKTALADDRLIHEINWSSQWPAVATAILESPWGKQIGDRGRRLAKQFELGIDQ
jgi:GH24 family phage-related lysozyme (muramidase)